MATKNETLARVGSFMQMGAIMARMIDSNTTGWDDKAGKIVERIGMAFVRASTGNLASGADMLDIAADELHVMAEEMRAGG